MVKSPNPKPIDYFRGVSMLSPTEIWAVGYQIPEGSQIQTLIERVACS